MQFRLGELFCGPGGIGMGARLANITHRGNLFSYKHMWATDYDKDTCATYRRNICPDRPEAVICRDIRELDFSILSDISSVDILAFGFPCNDFSIIGEQKGIDGLYGPLYRYCVKAVRHFKPLLFFAENVGGLRNTNDGNTFRVILEEFSNEGYVLYPHLYKFNEYGVPQTRHRIIIIGIRKDIDIIFRIPSPEPYRDMDISCRNAILDPPIPDNAPNNERTRQSPTVVKRLSYIRPGENAFTADMPEELRLNVRGARISQIYKRLEPDRPAYTVTGSGGGGTHMYHWSENRALTNRERARLQTFPDDFVFEGSKESVRRQIGMAVPVQGAKVILEAVLKTFAGIEYPYEHPNLVHSEGKLFNEGAV
ncbi:MAG: DNA cytosine methyltransferase [Clostridia bacterium]|nr:DNA cytosine methyltransferase [Clostridia bacterium]